MALGKGGLNFEYHSTEKREEKYKKGIEFEENRIIIEEPATQSMLAKISIFGLDADVYIKWL